MPIGKAKHRFWDRAPHSAQRAEGDRDRRTALRRLRSRSGGLWGFLRGCKGGDSEPLPRPLKGLFLSEKEIFARAASQSVLYQSDHLFKQITLARAASPPVLYHPRNLSIQNLRHAKHFQPFCTDMSRKAPPTSLPRCSPCLCKDRQIPPGQAKKCGQCVQKALYKARLFLYYDSIEIYFRRNQNAL